MTRVTGERVDVGLAGLHDHCGWVVSSDEEFVMVARRFLRSGARRGAKCIVVADAAMRPGVVAQPWFDECPGAEFWALDGFYGVDEPVRPDATVMLYEDATQRALEDGYSGLRVTADITSLVRTTAQRAAFVEYESKVDGLMTRMPMSAVCSIDRGRADAATVTALAAVHPSRRLGASPFGCAASRAGVRERLVLSGEVDHFHVDALDATLRGLTRLDPDATTEVDVAGLEFVDHGTLLHLDELARGRGHRFRLVGARPIVRRLVEILELTAVRAM